MVFWALMARVVGKVPLPPFVARFVPSRYSIQRGLHEAIRKARLMHMGVLMGFAVLMVATVYQEDTHILNHIKKAVPDYYLARVPTHPKGLSNDQLWGVIIKLVNSSVLNQNITHNGTFKGVVSVRQFRLNQNETRNFFPDCDFSCLDKGPLEVPNNSKVPSAYHYRGVQQVSWVRSQRCLYPPEGYTVYLGDLKNYTSNGNYLGVDPQVVLNESLSILDDLQQYSWVDNLTMAMLLTLIAPMPGTATPAAITVIFENPVRRVSEDSNPSPRWWSSHYVVAVDLRPNVVATVLMTVFLFVHFLVMWFEADVPFALIRLSPGVAMRRFITLTTAVHVIILVLHIVVVCLHFSSRWKAHYEVSKYLASFDVRFNPERFEDLNINILQITLASILSIKTTCSTLLSLELMLYLISFTLYQEHYSTHMTITMRTLRGGVLRAIPIVGPLLALLALVSYLVHVAHPAPDGQNFHTFGSAFWEALCNDLGTGRGVGVPRTTMEWMVRVTLVLVFMVNTLIFSRVCYQALEENHQQA